MGKAQGMSQTLTPRMGVGVQVDITQDHQDVILGEAHEMGTKMGITLHHQIRISIPGDHHSPEGSFQHGGDRGMVMGMVMEEVEEVIHPHQGQGVVIWDGMTQRDGLGW